MATLADVAQMAMDLYYQTYKSDDQFFELEHVMFLVCSAYAKMLNDEFLAEKQNAKVETGTSYVEISPSWIVKESKKVIKQGDIWFVDLDMGVFPFTFDAVANGVQRVLPKDANCCEFQKITASDIKFICQMPVTKKVFYNVVGKNRLQFYTNPGVEIDAYYVPELTMDTPNAQVSIEKVDDVINTALKLMFASKSGNAANLSNDTNPNQSNSSELAPNNFKQ